MSAPDRLLRWAPLAALGLITLLAAVMYHHVFAGEIAGDDLTFHLAESTRMADCLRAGDFDLWNPSANAGYASAYYYQAIPQLVPAVLATVTGTDVLPWFQLGVFLPLVLAPIAAYRGVRLIGTGPWPAVGAAFAILTCASNSRWGFGADGTFSVGLYTQTWALAAFPLALGHGVRWLRDGTGLGAAVGWGLFVGVCHPFAGIAIGIALVAGAAAVMIQQEVLPALRAETGAWFTRVDHAVFGEPREPVSEPPPPAPLQLSRVAIRLPALGVLLVIGSASAWLPVLVDYAGFGGFPHRVPDEVGPGFRQLVSWFVAGNVLDCAGFASRWRIMTVLCVVTFLFARDRALVWLWGGGFVFAFLLGLGPNLPTTGGDDLLPMVRFYGPMQICLALGLGVGTVQLALALWRRTKRMPDTALLISQAVIASALTLIVVGIAIPSVRIAWTRAQVSTDYEHIHRDQLRVVAAAIAAGPPGRKQARKGTENHWANLLPYVDARVPALVQMGGAGLQSSPNYDFLWTVSDPIRTGWVFDAPYVTFKTDAEGADEMPDGELVVQTEAFTVRRIPAPGLISPVQVQADPLPPERFAARKAAIEWLKSPGAMADRLRPYAGHPGISTAPAGEVRTVTRQESPGDSPDIVATVHTTEPTTFVVRESWHPRWRGFVDGREVALRRVTPDFFAVDVPAGEHAIAFRFDRPGWAWATWLLLILVPVLGRVLGGRLARMPPIRSAAPRLPEARPRAGGRRADPAT